MNRFELWDKVARNWQYRWQQPFWSVVALRLQLLEETRRPMSQKGWEERTKFK